TAGLSYTVAGPSHLIEGGTYLAGHKGILEADVFVNSTGFYASSSGSFADPGENCVMTTETNSFTGLFARAGSSGTAVKGQSGSGYGVAGLSSTGFGVFGNTTT